MAREVSWLDLHFTIGDELIDEPTLVPYRAAAPDHHRAATLWGASVVATTTAFRRTKWLIATPRSARVQQGARTGGRDRQAISRPGEIGLPQTNSGFSLM